MSRAIVVGGGISGLAIARALRARGVEPLVLESERRAGGKVRSERAGGYLVEHGPSGILGGEPAVTELVRELGLEDRVVAARPAARSRYIAVRGTLEPVPRGPGSFLRSRILSPRAKLRLLGDLFLPRGASGRGEEESVGAFARRRLGAGAAERIFAPLVSGIFAGDSEQLSLQSAFPRLAALERDHRSLILGALRGGQPRVRAGLSTFPGGVEELVQALVRDLGDAVRLGVRVDSVERRADGFAVATVGPDGDREELSAAAVVLASPAHASARLVRGLDGLLASTLSSIPYAAVALVELGYPERALPSPLDGFGFLVPPRERLQLLGAVFTSAVFDGRAPSGHVLVSARLGGLNAEVLHRTDDAVIQLAHEDLARVLGVAERPAFARVIRHERALPQYTLGHRERIERLRAGEARTPGLFLAGNALEGPGIPDCIRAAAGRAAAVARHLERTLVPS